MQILYSALSYLLHSLLLPWFVLHPKLRAGFFQRFWLLRPMDFKRRSARQDQTKDNAAGAPKKLRLWVHGSSAGDVLAQQPLIDALRKQTTLELTLTAFTKSGVDMARQTFAEAKVAFQPLDLPGATRRAVQSIDADLLILERAEIWPALIHAAHRHKTRVAIVNGRISPGSVKAYNRLFALAGPVLSEVDLFLMRDDDEATRVQQIGAATDRVHITGNTKLDKVQKHPDQTQIGHMAALLGIKKGDPLWVAGSTHRGEEELLFRIFATLQKTLPEARMLIAPRYVERADALEKMARAAGNFRVARRQRDDEKALHAAQIIILDSMGELAAVYALARLAFVGGTLIPRGGQNMLEPAMLAVPVVVGPYTDDARDQLALLSDQGLNEVEDGQTLQTRVLELMTDSARAKAQGARAAQAVQKGLGAAQRCTDLLLKSPADH